MVQGSPVASPQWSTLATKDYKNLTCLTWHDLTQCNQHWSELAALHRVFLSRFINRALDEDPSTSRGTTPKLYTFRVSEQWESPTAAHHAIQAKSALTVRHLGVSEN